MFIGVIIFLIYPNETELLKEYLPQYHSLTTNDYKLIKISFGILANLLALITS
jgi:adenine-specific DNA methylase